jgi:hypothetical protein
MLGSQATMYRRPVNLVAIAGLAAALFTAIEPVHAELPSFDDFYRGVFLQLR